MSLPKFAVDRAREQRRRQTPAENLLWQNLRNRKFKRLKFLRQHPIIYGEVFKSFFFIPDFYCDEAKLIIELDGEIHDFQQDYDKNRDQILKEVGLRVIRFKNEELINLDKVLAKIAELTHPPTPSLLRREGEVQGDGTEPSLPVSESSLNRTISNQIQSFIANSQPPTSPSLRSTEGWGELTPTDTGSSITKIESKHKPTNTINDQPSPSLRSREGRGELAIILLAAGSSSRMGQSKQLLTIDGKPLLLKSAEAALGAGANKTFVVLGANEGAHCKIIDHLPLEILYNSNWEKGMGTSLRMGLNKALKIVPGLEAVMIVVCDQPLVNSLHLNNLIQKYRTTKSPIVASAYANTVGVPALFDQSFFQKLLAVEESQGAKKILMDHAESVLSIDFPDGAIDLDTLGDYTAFLKFNFNGI